MGEGTPIIILHGLMGGLSNFHGVMNHFPPKGYKVLVPELPIYDMPLLKTNVKSFAKFLEGFIEHKSLKDVILLGNSLGGHIGLLHTKLYPKKVKALVITGSSGLYDPEVATKEIVDEVFATVNDRIKLVKTLAIAKSAIRHNMSKDLPHMLTPTCIIWGKNDSVTPPNVAEEFHALLPDSDLYWIDKCGHAPMMEHPQEFNTVLDAWLEKRNF